MRFDQVHTLAAYLVALSALSALFFGSGLTGLEFCVALGVLVFSWRFGDVPVRRRARRHSAHIVSLWNIATVVVAGFLIWRGIQGASILIMSIHFLVYILINRLYNRRSSKEYQQINVVAFLMMVAATTLNGGLSYGLAFVVFALAMTWSTILRHLRSEMEHHDLIKHQESEGASVSSGHDIADQSSHGERIGVRRLLRSRRIVGAKFLATTALFSFSLVVSALLVFFFFPRIGMGFFGSAKRPRIAMMGFSESVKLGHHGAVRSNHQVIMRVTFERDGVRLNDPRDVVGRNAVIRWRGSVFDHYEDGRWEQSRDILGRRALPEVRGGLYLFNRRRGKREAVAPESIKRGLLVQHIYLEPLQSTVLVAADRPIALAFEAALPGVRRPFAPRRGPFGEIRAAKQPSLGIRYLVYSAVNSPKVETLARAKPVSGHPDLSRFLALPKGFPRRVVQLAERVVAGKTSVLARVKAIERFLADNYRYTLDLVHAEKADPIEEFLFETKAGHCEYFASSFALMLRAVGIHSRHVNGFLAGQWNPYGRYLAVSQNNAHAWTEVLFANVGWVAFDATPKRGRPAAVAAGLSTKVRQFIDAARLRWYAYIVEYRLESQIKAFYRARDWLKSLGASASPAGYSAPVPAWTFRRLIRDRRAWVLLAIAFFLAGLTIWRIWGRSKGRVLPSWVPFRSSRHPAKLYYERALSLLRVSGYEKPSSQTPRHFVDTVAERSQAAGLALDKLTRYYYGSRFGGKAWSPSQDEAFSRYIGELRRALREP